MSARAAAADIVVPRELLGTPQGRQRIRFALYEALRRMGYVESITRYVRDPKDGPYADTAFDILDRDTYAVVRVEAMVVPRSDTLDSGGAGAIS